MSRAQVTSCDDDEDDDDFDDGGGICGDNHDMVLRAEQMWQSVKDYTVALSVSAWLRKTLQVFSSGHKVIEVQKGQGALVGPELIFGATDATGGCVKFFPAV